MKFIRFKGLLAFLILLVLIYVLTAFYMDGFIRRTIVKQGTRVNGALVELDSARFSFLRSRFALRGLCATDPQNLMQNRLEVENLIADLKFLPLLRKKIVIDSVRVQGVEWGTPRKKPGNVPASWQREWTEAETKESPWAQALKEMKARYVVELPNVSLEELEKRFDPRTFVKLEDLSVYREMKAFSADFKELESRWKKKIDQSVAGSVEKLSKLRAEMEALDPKGIRSPQDAVKALQTARGVRTKVQEQKRMVLSLKREARDTFRGKIRQVASFTPRFRSDLNRLKGKIGIGDLKLSRLSESIFGLDLVDRYARFRRFCSQGESWLNRLRGNENKKNEKDQRHRGRNVRFRMTHLTPKFLLSDLQLSAETTKSADVSSKWKGSFELRGKDLSSHPELIGRPAQVWVSAETPNGRFKTSDLYLRYSSVEGHHLKLKVKVSGQRLEGVKLGEAGVFSIPLKEGRADWQGELETGGDLISAAFRGDFSHLKYAFSKEETIHPVVKVLQDVLTTVSKFHMNVKVRGRSDKPSFGIASTLDEALRKGIEQKILAKVKKAREKLEAYLNKEMQPRIQKAQRQALAQKKRVEAIFSDHLGQVESVEKLAEERIQNLMARQKEFLRAPVDRLKKKMPKKKLKKDGDKLRKSLGF